MAEDIYKYLKGKKRLFPDYHETDNPPISGADMRRILPQAHVCWVNELRSIPLDKKPIVALWPCGGSNHWVSINNGRKDYFDSYGEEPPAEITGCNIFKGKWQKSGVDCGKYVILRTLNDSMSNDIFQRKVEAIGIELDKPIERLIDLLIN
jgi:hypothetical protein